MLITYVNFLTATIRIHALNLLSFFEQDISHKGKEKEKGKSPNLVSEWWKVLDSLITTILPYTGTGFTLNFSKLYNVQRRFLGFFLR